MSEFPFAFTALCGGHKTRGGLGRDVWHCWLQINAMAESRDGHFPGVWWIYDRSTGRTVIDSTEHQLVLYGTIGVAAELAEEESPIVAHLGYVFDEMEKMRQVLIKRGWMDPPRPR